MSTVTKSTRRGRVLFPPACPVSSPGKSISYLKEKVEAKNHEGALFDTKCIFTNSFYIIYTHMPSDGTARSGLGPPISISNQENSSTDMSTGQSDGGNSLTEVPVLRCIIKFRHHTPLLPLCHIKNSFQIWENTCYLSFCTKLQIFLYFTTNDGFQFYIITHRYLKCISLQLN